MENSSNSVKTFMCSKHPEEAIQRVSKDVAAKKMLFCIECLMECDKNVKSSLIDIKSFVDQMYEGFSKVKPARINTPPPESLKEIAENSEEYCYKMIQHISAQKEKVSSEIKKIQEEFNEKLEKSKEKILSSFDIQLAFYKKNIEDYNAKLVKFFKSDHEDQDETVQRSDIVSGLNQCRTHLDLETKIKSLLISLKEGQSNSLGDDIEFKLVENIKAHKAAILNSLETPPIPVLTNQELNKFNLEKLNEAVAEYSKGIERFKNPISAFRFSEYNSDIIDVEDFQYIFSKIKADTHFKIKLLEKTSTKSPDFKFIDFEKNWLKNPHTLCILRKELQVYAVYKDGVFKMPQQLGFGGQPYSNIARTITYELESKSQLDIQMTYLQMYRNGSMILLSNYLYLYPGDLLYHGNGKTGLMKSAHYDVELELYQLDFDGKANIEVSEL